MKAALEVLFVFLRLGCTSFGGPVAHLAYFRAEFVERRRWVDDATFADLMALCQFLPGPASSQLAFAIGQRRAGLPGAIAAFAGFTLPAAALMTLFAYGLLATNRAQESGWLQGLKTAAVAVVAHAVWQMARSLCPDVSRALLALFAAFVALLWPGAGGQIAAIAIGGYAGWFLYRRDASQTPSAEIPVAPRHHFAAAGVLLLFAGLLVGLPFLARNYSSGAWAISDSFFRVGSLVFGGGHVVLPLLRAEFVPRGWVSDDLFLAGYGAAQAVPGPLFSFAAYLGASASVGPGGWRGGLLGILSIFLPAWLLVGGTLPFWHTLRRQSWAQAALRGTNAAVVGLLLAALCNPVIREGVHGMGDALLAIALFGLLQFARCPAWAVVLIAAAVGWMRY